MGHPKAFYGSKAWPPALIHSQENVKFSCLCRLEKVAIPKSCQSGVAGCLAIVTGQRIAESLVDAFVDQDAHLGARE
jgi:hypothetical protein